MAFNLSELLAHFAKGKLISFISAVSSLYTVIALSFSAPAAKSSMNVLLCISGAAVRNMTLCLSACSLNASDSKNGLQVRPNGSRVKRVSHNFIRRIVVSFTVLRDFVPEKSSQVSLFLV